MFFDCPLCSSSDRIQKVSAILSSSTLTGSFSGPTIDFSDGEFGIVGVGGRVSTQLAEMLAPPPEPHRGLLEGNDSYERKLKPWQAYMRTWHRLYYCYRDDIVFDPFTTLYRPSHSIGQLVNMILELQDVQTTNNWSTEVIRRSKDAANDLNSVTALKFGREEEFFPFINRAEARYKAQLNQYTPWFFSTAHHLYAEAYLLVWNSLKAAAKGDASAIAIIQTATQKLDEAGRAQDEIQDWLNNNLSRINQFINEQKKKGF